jgi:hypothetical protein
MHTISLLNTPECPCSGTHYAACTEFMEGFANFHKTIITNTMDCTSSNIILMSHCNDNIDYLHKLNSLNPDAVYIMWFFDKIYDKIPFKHFILTGEQFIHRPKLPRHIEFFELCSKINNSVPLCLRANEDPENVGKYERIHKYNGCFIGTTYKPDWCYTLNNIYYYSIYGKRLLNYEERRNIYLSSKIAFGFSADDNIINSHVTQRVFEGLAAGCIVISDNPAARDMTNGIVVYAENKAEFLKLYNYYINAPEDIIEAKRNEGYNWVKQFGTNRYSANLFLTKINELWNITF